MKILITKINSHALDKQLRDEVQQIRRLRHLAVTPQTSTSHNKFSFSSINLQMMTSTFFTVNHFLCLPRHIIN